ncbi:ComF family protein [Miltoncostaea marina]|uniref:ComF family protein n=1 Tax=Miltoncostaea marina TaxID=2843215 RepID=UPI001C3C2300|nr:ComF family protein [Miltoncostaea marina]
MGLDAILDVLLPPSCGACGLPGAAVCAACRSALTPPAPPLCGGCGAQVGVPVERCPACRGWLAGARQAVRYEGPAPALVAALKDGRRRGLAPALAAIVVAEVPPPPAGAALVPVPLGPRRARERGFNQALLLAQALGRAWGLPVAQALRRAREGPPQRGARASARGRQAAGAFAAGGRDPVPPLAWLVDDVHTTGATLADCARALRSAGAREVGAVCFARVPPGG